MLRVVDELDDPKLRGRHTLSELIQKEGVAQDLAIPVQYLNDRYMVCEHRKAHRRQMIGHANIGAVAGVANAAEMLLTDERMGLETCGRWGSSLASMYDTLSNGESDPGKRQFSDLLSVRRSAAASIGCEKRTGPHAEPGQSFASASHEGLSCWNLLENKKVCVRLAKGLAPESSEIGELIGMQLQATASMQSQAEDLANDASIMDNPREEEWKWFEDKKEEEGIAEFEDACMRFPPDAMLRGANGEMKKLVNVLVQNILKNYRLLPLGVRLDDALALENAIKRAKGESESQGSQMQGLIVQQLGLQATTLAAIAERFSWSVQYAEKCKEREKGSTTSNDMSELWTHMRDLWQEIRKCVT